MSRAGQSPRSLLYFTISAILCIYCSLLFYLNKSDRYFPALPAGEYSGEITGIFPGPAIPIYLRSEGKGSTLSIIAAKSGWISKQLSPSLVKVRSKNSTITSAYHPLQINTTNNTYSIYGIERNNRYFGEIRSSDNIKGKWSIKKTDSQYGEQ